MVEPNSSQEPRDNDKYEKALKSKSPDIFILCLYVSNMSFKSVQAIQNIKKICEENVPGRYKLDIIDIRTHPAIAREKQIIAAPTLIKESPSPLRRLVGNMSNTERVLTGLGLCSIA